ncbi:MAG TPA: FAD-dependent monooxygenase [Ramlibacter sp.]|nr:FAD-dependent monooxygenase [Ramlibacter sp.]
MSPSSRNKLPIVIAGGGIGGLACALALAQKNFQVLVCEQAPQFGQVGAGLQVAPNALSVLDALGVGADVKAGALLIERMVMRDAHSGDEISNIPCGCDFQALFGNPYAVAHRADVHGALLEGCRAVASRVELRTNSVVTGYVLRDDGVDVMLEGGGMVAAAALIGADGIRSKVRQQLVGDGEPQAAGAVIYRALIPAEQMPPDVQKPFPTLWAGPGGHIIYYPVRGWAQFNVGATAVKPVDGLTEGPASVDEAIEAFQGWNATPLGVLKIPGTFQRYIIRHRVPVENWSDGAVTLLGDSAHSMVQYIAQGAAMALEDALCLADRVDALDGDFRPAFQAYQAVRIVRSARVQLSSLMLGRLYHPAGVERLVRDSLFKDRTAEDYYQRLAWLFTAPSYVTQWQAAA